MAETYPRLGHEASGVVAGVRSIVKDFEVGDVVTTFGLQAYADYIVTTPDTTVKLPPGIDPIQALGEPISSWRLIQSQNGWELQKT